MKPTIASHFSFFEKLPKNCEAFRLSDDQLVIYDIVDGIWRCKLQSVNPREISNWVKRGEGKDFTKASLLVLFDPDFYKDRKFDKNDVFIVEPTKQFFEDKKREPEFNRALVLYDDYYIKNANYQFKKIFAKRLPELDGIL